MRSSPEWGTCRRSSRATWACAWPRSSCGRSCGRSTRARGPASSPPASAAASRFCARRWPASSSPLWAAALALRARASGRGLGGRSPARSSRASGSRRSRVTYHRYGGFADITSLPPANPTVAQAAVALGVALPLGIAGLVLGWKTVPGTDLPAPIRGGSASSSRSPRPHAPSASRSARAGRSSARRRSCAGCATSRSWRSALAVPAGLAAERGLARARAGSARPAAALALAAGIAAAVASTALAAVELGRAPTPATLRCGPLPFGYGDVFAVVSKPQLGADRASLDVFAQTGASAAYMTLVRAKVRPRTFPDRPPTQAERRRWRDELRAGRSPVPGGVWVVAGAGSPAATGGTRVTSCSLAGRPAVLVRYPPA